MNTLYALQGFELMILMLPTYSSFQTSFLFSFLFFSIPPLPEASPLFYIYAASSFFLHLIPLSRVTELIFQSFCLLLSFLLFSTPLYQSISRPYNYSIMSADNWKGGGQELLHHSSTDNRHHHHHEVASNDKKYGGLAPKKKPLISKDHQRAFFDSADWVLYKSAGLCQDPTVAVETLRPKLQKTQHQQLPPRRPACTSGSGSDSSASS